jgi:hypothetical protein
MILLAPIELATISYGKLPCRATVVGMPPAGAALERDR